MGILELKQRQDITADSKLNTAYTQFGTLIDALKKKQLTPAVADAVNAIIEQVNATSPGGKELTKMVKASQQSILKTLEKEMKIVPRNHFRKLWMVVGMSSFGLPLGVAFGMLMKNMGMLGLGLPIGMAIGLALGSSMDKKAVEEGRQLDFEAKL